MVRLCLGLSKAASCFCLPSKDKIERDDNDENNAFDPNNFPLAQSMSDGKPCHTSILPDAPSQASAPKSSSPVPQESNQSSLNGGQDEDNKIEWTSGARREKIEINWQVKDFPALCELKELLRNETLVFSAGQSIGAPTRWCFNLQKMKNENNIGLFLKRLKPLSLDEDNEDFENRNRNNGSGPLAVGLVNGNPQLPIRNISASIDEDDSDLDETVYIHYECIIRRSGHGDVWLHKRTCIPNFEVGQRLGFRKLFTMDDLREADTSQSPSTSGKVVPLFSEDNTLNLFIRFNLHLRSNGKTKIENDLLEAMTQESDERFHSHLLSAEFGCLLESGNNSDLILVMDDDDKTFAVHKAILTARSEVFSAMLHSGMKESRTGIVRIKDVPSTAMESLLSYVYTGNVSMHMKWGDVREVQDLIYAADKYLVKGLRDLCDQSMSKGCNKDNAMELLYLAQNHGLNVAVKNISTFIRRNVHEVLCPQLKRY